MNALNFEFAKLVVDALEAGPNVRKDVVPAEIDALATSLKVQQLQPIIVGPDRCTLIDGWRRLLAAKKAKMPFLWAVITDRPLSREELVAAQLAMDLHRKNFSEQERVTACEQLLTMNPDLNQKQLAERLCVDAATVCRWLSASPDRVIASVREAFLAGQIGLKAVYPISQVPKESQQALLDLALAGATRQQLAAQVRRQPRADAMPEARASRIRCVLPGGATITVCGESLCIDDVIEQLSGLLREAKRARDQSLDLRTFERVLADRARAATA